ncbi:ATP-binding cassette transporter [Clonorchis sinensis]|uniref:ATP-binding cassette transporter n=1 Tax=Clonorchis sinensis TaxID=79923 RepID=G7YM55_CLOSI|nr:ATP-binding cassette transporter [Clonorchis sinensis]
MNVSDGRSLSEPWGCEISVLNWKAKDQPCLASFMGRILSLEDGWRRVKEAMLSAFRTACPAHLIRLNEHWISSRSADLIAARKSIPASSDYDGARRSLKRRIIRSLKNDRERWWISKAQEMEKAFAAGNSRALFQLIRSTGQKKAGVSETICRAMGLRDQCAQLESERSALLGQLHGENIKPPQ